MNNGRFQKGNPTRAVDRHGNRPPGSVGEPQPKPVAPEARGLLEGTLWFGIDPGTRNVGLALLAHDTQRRWHAVHIETLSFKSNQDLDERMTKILEVIRLRPDQFPRGTMWVKYVVEEQERARNAARAIGETNFRADRVERVMGMIWAVAHHHASNPPLLEVTPSEMRQTLGLPANASKEQMAALVSKLVSGLPKKMSKHAFDAVVVAITGRKVSEQRRLIDRTRS